MKYFEKIKSWANDFFTGTDISIDGETEDEVLDALEGLPKASEFIANTVDEKIEAKTKEDDDAMASMASEIETLKAENKELQDKNAELLELYDSQNKVTEALTERFESFETDMSEKVKDLTDKYANVTSKGVTDGGQKGKPALTKAEKEFKKEAKAFKLK